MRSICPLAVLIFVFHPSLAQKPFTPADWEARFRAIPSSERQREYVHHLSARPHHVGSPYGKENAEWLAATFKQWGLETKTETFDVLFPTPKERLVELLEADSSGSCLSCASPLCSSPTTR